MKKTVNEIIKAGISGTTETQVNLAIGVSLAKSELIKAMKKSNKFGLTFEEITSVIDNIKI